MSNSRNSDWIESGGGPLVLVAEGDLKQWAGTDLVGDDTVSDYDRACALVGAIKALSARGAEVLVLGEEPDSTLVLPIDGLVHLLRWRWAPDDDAMWEALSQADLPGLGWTEDAHFQAREQNHRLFDSAYPGTEMEESRVVVLEPGSYIVETADFEPSKAISMQLHRFRRL